MNDSNNQCNMVNVTGNEFINAEMKSEIKIEYEEEIKHKVKKEVKHESNKEMSSGVTSLVKEENEEHKAAGKHDIKEEIVEAYEEFEYLPDDDVKPDTAESKFNEYNGFEQDEEHRNKRVRKGNPLSKELPTSSQDLQTDMDISKTKILKCTKCQFIATKSTSLQQHQLIHISKAPYHCTKCGYEAEITSNFNYHILDHNDDKPFICPHCGKAYAGYQFLKRHCSSQHMDTLLRCNKCEFSTLIPTELKTHGDQFHSVDRVILKCEKCSFIATKSNSLDLHHVVHTSKKPYRCTRCGYETGATARFNFHILGHNDDEPFICPRCGKAYRCYQYLKTHSSSQHLDASSLLRCNKCEFSTLISTELKTHEERFHPIDRVILKCEKCMFIATKSNSLDLHQVVHTSEKPYRCEASKCDFQSAIKNHFNTHILSHNSDKPYRCIQCRNCFSRSTDLKRHQQSFHM